MGDCLHNLWVKYRDASSTHGDALTPLSALVQQIRKQAGFSGGAQQDAAECLMHVLQAVDGGRMQQRVCGAYAAASLENMIMCRTQPEAQVSRDAPPVRMGEMLISALTDEQGLGEDPPALVIRVENIYEQSNEYFAVDAQAAWDFEHLDVTVLGRADTTATYRVTGYVAHVHSGEADAMQRMRSGHYVAYLHVDGEWYEADD